MSSEIVKDLIFDIGASEGNDTDFYLKKGFRVVAVEADPVTYQSLLKRFASQLESGQLSVKNRVAAGEPGQSLEFFVNHEIQGHSRLAKEGDVDGEKGAVYRVGSITWQELVAEFGTPYYSKVDIEGGEPPLLRSVRPGPLPTYISTEAHSLEPISALYEIGYRAFRLIDQRMHWRWGAPNPPLEGSYVPDHKFVHASGLFGRELPGSRWYAFEDIAHLYGTIRELHRHETIMYTWFDCHARIEP